MNFSFLDKYLPYFLSGAVVTIVISILTVIFGTMIGLAMALMKRSKIKPWNWLANSYIELLRGTPMLLQIMIGFILLQRFFPAVDWSVGILTIDLGRLIPGIIVLSLNSGAYVAEIIRGGIAAVDMGQTEASYSLGLRPIQAMRYVIFPQALRNILPPLGNEFVTLIKDSSLLTVIGINELMGSAQIVISNSYIPLEPYFIAAGLYFVMTFVTSRLLSSWEKKLGKGYQR
ncbi:amino acid ABC transporter permease [Enterococcus mundtii]|uniref:amino acid ABC transporter permease n=1 Tax=Enterococcus TaxID=1350 RepID=UPI001CF57957|nr:amino acid ABC transporter permease [Enterococcus mundtii]MCA6774629.1 amino acid ABC transporter permease [Enterococcus mundtii]MRI74322.1 amino acid ABC transporter permease [Enterococcus mundtii]GKS54571.1 glutamine ABC transporter permease protein [Enterococcus mundtii]